MSDLNFGDLEQHPAVTKSIENLQNSIDTIEDLSKQLIAIKDGKYSNLGMYDKINYDLFVSYTLNTLYWMYLRTCGEDPNENDVKKELKRIKEYMVTAKRVHDRHTIRPRLDQGAAKRFITHNQPAEKRRKLNEK